MATQVGERRAVHAKERRPGSLVPGIGDQEIAAIRQIDGSNDAVADGNRVDHVVKCKRTDTRIGLQRQLGPLQMSGRDGPKLTADELNAASGIIRSRDCDRRRACANPLQVP